MATASSAETAFALAPRFGCRTRCCARSTAAAVMGRGLGAPAPNSTRAASVTPLEQGSTMERPAAASMCPHSQVGMVQGPPGAVG